MGVNPRLLIIGSGVQGDCSFAGGSRHVQAEVVLLDKTHGDFSAPLYQVQAYPEVSHSLTSAVDGGGDSFVLIGKVLELRKADKQILISNSDPNSEGDLVSYRYLIVAGGGKNSLIEHDAGEDFSMAMAALGEALRIQRALYHFNPPTRYSGPSPFHCADDCHPSYSVIGPDSAPQACTATAAVAKKVEVPVVEPVAFPASSKVSYDLQLL